MTAEDPNADIPAGAITFDATNLTITVSDQEANYIKNINTDELYDGKLTYQLCETTTSTCEEFDLTYKICEALAWDTNPVTDASANAPNFVLIVSDEAETDYQIAIADRQYCENIDVSIDSISGASTGDTDYISVENDDKVRFDLVGVDNRDVVTGSYTQDLTITIKAQFRGDPNSAITYPFQV